MRIAFYDVESSGMDPVRDHVIEVATILYSVKHAAPIQTYSSLILSTSNGAEAINGISPLLLASGESPELVWIRTRELLRRADFIVGHNCGFDYDFTPTDCRGTAPWVCSMNDLSFGTSPRGTTLAALALSQGVPLLSAHRALPDVDTLMRLFQRVQERGADITEMFRLAMRPKVIVQGLAPFEQNQLMKDAGFRWEPAPKKRWVKKMFKEEHDTTKFGFETKVVPT